MSKEHIPTLLPYPSIMPLNTVPELDGRLVYVIKGYRLCGYSAVIFRQNGKFGITAGDFDGNILEPHKLQIAPYYSKITELMFAARIKQAQFYFSDGVLVDIRTAIDKMCSPGMIKDLCANILPTQEIIKVQNLNDLRDELDTMGYIIIKHSSFKVITRGNTIVPLYGARGYETDIISKEVIERGI